MHEPSIFGLPNPVTTMLVSTALAVVGLTWLHRTLGMDELLGNARWRYRDRGWVSALKRLAKTFVRMPFTRTFGWWATRFEFALAIGALVLATVALTRVPPVSGDPIGDGLALAVLPLVAYAGIVFGIAWMRRIYLSPLEVDPEVGFRYRS